VSLSQDSTGTALCADEPAKGCRAELRRLFARAVHEAYAGVHVNVALVPCAQPKFGDYQCNNAMAIFAELKKAGGAEVPKNPRSVAEALVAQLKVGHIPMIESLTCAPATFSRQPALDSSTEHGCA
jgi:arginyl-tRNA synthetase